MHGLLHGGFGIYLSRDFPFHSDKCSCSSSSSLSSSLYSPFGDFMAAAQMDAVARQGLKQEKWATFYQQQLL